jgi:signal transduction histidine kinase
MKQYPLLPPTLTGKTPNDSLVSVRVSDATGAVLYQSASMYESPYRATYEYPKLGGYTVSVVIRPDVADKLVIGGLPQSRLPLLLGLLALAGALTAVALLQLRREAELARLRSDFISGISHELRTPLAQVRMFAETLLLDRVRSEGERRRSLEIIDQEARRLTHLVENVLQFSRNERSVTRLSLEPTDVAAEMREVVEAFAPIASARGVTLATTLGEGCTTEVDRAALRQVLLNFMDNAVKYGPPGQTVTIGTRCAEGALQLWVDDQGPGIPARERARVWEPFQRLERDANSAVAGSGIGLSVVRDLVALHGGRSWVEDAPGGGARFIIELPREDTVPAAGTSPGSNASLSNTNGRASRPRAGV